jgi:hypothetical protein
VAASIIGANKVGPDRATAFKQSEYAVKIPSTPCTSNPPPYTGKQC